MSLLRLEGVGKRFVAKGRHRRPLYRELLGWSGSGSDTGHEDDFDALADISLEFDRGDRVALVGPNGAGKSTLLRTMAGIYTPSSGRRSAEGRVACFFEAGAGMAPVLSVHDNVLLYSAIIGLSRERAEARFDAILEFAGLEGQRFARVEHLSFGTQQRLFFTVMLETMELGGADIFLFDEMLGGADFRFKQRAEDRLSSLERPDALVVYAAHELEAMQRLCKHGIYLKGGRIAVLGSVDEAVEAYRADCS